MRPSLQLAPDSWQRQQLPRREACRWRAPGDTVRDGRPRPSVPGRWQPTVLGKQRGPTRGGQARNEWQQEASWAVEWETHEV